MLLDRERTAAQLDMPTSIAYIPRIFLSPSSETKEELFTAPSCAHFSDLYTKTTNLPSVVAAELATVTHYAHSVLIRAAGD